uniref:Uncharacterized protein n=1 Tax=Aeromonas caviae TaxID=648 RepID=A0A1L0CSR3_AERCA|nr:Uncharacterised protein [Aeromonas caviae]
MVRGRNVTSPIWIGWVGQPVPCVYLVPECVKLILRQIARRLDVQGLARAQFNPRRNKVQLVVPSVAVPDPHDVVLI